jgi:hypothetical protein
MSVPQGDALCLNPRRAELLSKRKEKKRKIAI